MMGTAANTPNNDAPVVDIVLLWLLHCFCRKKIDHLVAAKTTA
jgi:hypothetical protein